MFSCAVPHPTVLTSELYSIRVRSNTPPAMKVSTNRTEPGPTLMPSPDLAHVVPPRSGGHGKDRMALSLLLQINRALDHHAPCSRAPPPLCPSPPTCIHWRPMRQLRSRPCARTRVRVLHGLFWSRVPATRVLRRPISSRRAHCPAGVTAPPRACIAVHPHSTAIRLHRAPRAQLHRHANTPAPLLLSSVCRSDSCLAATVTRRTRCSPVGTGRH